MAAASPVSMTCNAAYDRADTQASWVYTLQVASPPPEVDLDATLLARLLSQPELERFYELMTAKYAAIGAMFRVALLLVLVILFVPQAVGRWISPLVIVLTMPAAVLSLLMYSVDLMQLITRHFEFWFFAIMNAVNWMCLASFYSDLRMLSLFCGWAGTQLVIMTDANFRTVLSAIRSSVIAAPVILVLAAAVFFRLIDTPESNFRAIPVANIEVMLSDVFINTAITLAIFVLRKAYLRRRLLHATGETLKTIRCVVVRAKLQLKSRSCPDPRFPSPPSRVAIRTANPVSHRQPLKLIPLAISTVDVRDLVCVRFAPLTSPLSMLSSLFLCTCGITGSVAMLVTLTRRPALVGSPASPQELAIASAALVFTLLFFGRFAASFHRILAKSLLRSFDFLFSSVQFTLSMLLVSDMMQWDFRVLGALAWLLWFHLVLFLDALTPPIKRNLRFRKIYLLPVVVATLVGIAFIIYEFFFTDSARYFRDRTLLTFAVRNQVVVQLRTKSLLINRLATVLLWSCRLIWEVVVCPEDELTFIRGHLEYYTPLPMFPPLVVTPPDSTTPSTRILTTTTAKRRAPSWRSWATNAVHPENENLPDKT